MISCLSGHVQVPGSVPPTATAIADMLEKMLKDVRDKEALVNLEMQSPELDLAVEPTQKQKAEVCISADDWGMDTKWVDETADDDSLEDLIAQVEASAVDAKKLTATGASRAAAASKGKPVVKTAPKRNRRGARKKATNGAALQVDWYDEDDLEAQFDKGGSAEDAAAVAHAAALLAQYEAELGKEMTTEFGQGSSSGGNGEDKYEKPGIGAEEMSDTDVAFAKFQKRIALLPGQCVRYCYDSALLLWPSAFSRNTKTVGPTAEDLGVPRCTNCGSRRMFEFQLMVSLCNRFHAWVSMWCDGYFQRGRD